MYGETYCVLIRKFLVIFVGFFKTYFCTFCQVVINIDINNILNFFRNIRHHVNSKTTHMFLLLCMFNVLAFYESNNIIMFPIIMFIMPTLIPLGLSPLTQPIPL
jgi:hypothetical protein